MRAWNEIEFRCFTGDTEKMIYGVFPVTDRVLIRRTDNGRGYEELWVECDEVMQYTGLKDRTGKKIFEGDILKVKNPFDGCWSTDGAVVEFSYDYIGGWVVSNGKQNLNIGTRQKNLQVIGNIYETPELLEKSE